MTDTEKPRDDEKPAAAGTPAAPETGPGEVTPPLPEGSLPDPSDVEARVIEALRGVYDPEIPVNIYELGLVYGVEVSPEGRVRVRMTLTTPACPVAGSLPGEVEVRVNALEGVTEAVVEVVWDPPWDPSKMTEAARLQLGLA